MINDKFSMGIKAFSCNSCLRLEKLWGSASLRKYISIGVNAYQSNRSLLITFTNKINIKKYKYIKIW